MRHIGGCVPSPFCVPAAPQHTGRRVKTAIHPMTNRRFFLISGTYAPASAVQMARAVLHGLRNDGKGGTSLSELPASLCRAALAGLRFTAVFVPKSRLKASDRPRHPWRPSESRPPDTRLSNIRFLSAKKKKYSPSKAQTILPLELMVGIEPTTC